MGINRLEALGHCHQSVWLDFIRRNLIESGELAKLVAEDGISGVTSNPSIFKNAIAASTDYNDIMLTLFKDADLSIKSIYEQCAISDIQAAADILRPIYNKTKKADGYVSMEVPPELARDTQGTIIEAKRLWQAVNRPNLLVKVPGTAEGVLAIRELIAEGINVNVTLLFSIDAYKKVADAYMEGLERRLQAKKPIDHIASVASFFVSRLDVLINRQIDAAPNKTPELLALKGKIAIAYAKTAYQQFKAMKETPRYKALAAKGAQPQRLLWASTSTKDPAYSDVLYVESLIGSETVDTIPPETMNAFRDHGKAASGTLEDGLDEAYMDLQTLERYGISLEAATKTLLEEGIDLFHKAFQDLLNAVTEKKKAYESANKVNGKASALSPIFSIKFSAPENQDAIAKEMADWQTKQKVSKLWAADNSLWTSTDENQWMGWLHIADIEQTQVPQINALASELQGEGIKHVVVLGMGGSSLCPAMLATTYPRVLGYPQLHVLDSTDPSQIKHLEKKLDLNKTVFIVSSKSGSTLEPNIFEQYFYKRLQTVLSRDNVGDRFIVITDPGSKLAALAQTKNFRATYLGLPSIGGRYSALSNFGMVPGGLMGIDLIDFLQHAEAMMHACNQTKVQDNPGVVLGIILGVCAKHGKNKVTLVASPGILALGAWLEQLLAESTGKVGKGLIPVDNELLADPSFYGKDRVFAYIRLDSEPDKAQDNAIDKLEKAGHVVVRLHLANKSRLAEQLFQWEIATAVAGSVIGINAFNQPDVESAKVRALQLAHEFDKDGTKPQEKALCSDNGLTVFAPSLAKSDTVINCLRSLLSEIKAGDYVDLAAFIEMSDEHHEVLQEIRTLIRDNKKVATCLGFGPRFLHSTGQAYKGGPNTGVFIQLTADHDDDLAVPDHRFTFGFVINAQAIADYEELVKRGRRLVRVHLGKDVKKGLNKLKSMIQEIL